MQVLWLDVFRVHEAVNACGGRVGNTVCVKVDYVSEFDEGHGQVVRSGNTTFAGMMICVPFQLARTSHSVCAGFSIITFKSLGITKDSLVTKLVTAVSS